MQTIKVKKIEIGSTIGVFSPSEPIVENRISRFNNGISILESNGFKVRLSSNALKHTNFTAGTIDDRVSDINELINADEVNALISSWGGKSCNQLINFLDYSTIKQKQKAIFGFSDAGVLLNNITARTGLITFYGPNVLGKLDETEHAKLELLKGENFESNILGNVEKVACRVLKNGAVDGKLIGGNLSTFVLGVVCSDIPVDFFDEAILFWESASDTPQLINLYLTAIANRGILNKIKGMIIGDFITGDTREWKRTDDFNSIKNALSKYNFPILYAPTFGHKKLENPLIPIGAYCHLDTKNHSLKLIEQIIE